MKEQSDTSQEASDFQIALLRSMTTSERLALAFKLSATAITLSKRAIRRANPDISENELRCCFVELHYGKILADNFRQYLKERSV
jgi:hypothetical protein